jgi:hypothetical protein
MGNTRTRSSARVVSATTAAKNFGTLIDRVREERAAYVVERSGSAVVLISPAPGKRCSVAGLVELLRAYTSHDAAYAAAVKKGVAALNRPAVPENRWEP